MQTPKENLFAKLMLRERGTKALGFSRPWRKEQDLVVLHLRIRAWEAERQIIQPKISLGFTA
ncbi:MAG: hypothetical protein ACKO9A_19995 [Alphaproteobacteria bacterium]